MKYQMLLLIAVFCWSCSGHPNEKEEEDQTENAAEATSQEEQAWTVLFDGSDTDAWIELGEDSFSENGWVIQDNSLVLQEGGNIITREKYGNFELKFEFMLTKGANSGVKYFVSELVNTENGDTVINGPEYQIIDDISNPDIQDRTDEKSTTASLYLLYEPQNKTLHPPGEWNTAKIISQNGQVEHWLNEKKVLTYERGGEDFLTRKAATKFKPYVNYGEVESGHIMLTDHHDKVYFRNIMVRSN